MILAVSKFMGIEHMGHHSIKYCVFILFLLRKRANSNYIRDKDIPCHYKKVRPNERKTKGMPDSLFFIVTWYILVFAIIQVGPLKNVNYARGAPYSYPEQNRMCGSEYLEQSLIYKMFKIFVMVLPLAKFVSFGWS